MFGVHFIKFQPTTYVIEYSRGKIKREGAGLAFFYFGPTTSLVSIPIASTDVPFIIKETTADFQEVTVQGQVTYRIKDPKRTAEMLNFTLDSRGKVFVSDDPVKLSQRIISHVQVLTRIQLQKTSLKDALLMSDVLVESILSKLRLLDDITSLGLEILGLSILAIKPNPETARALEAEVRELLLKESDQAIYARRNAAVEQERAIKENELNTELAVEHKKREIREAQMDAEIAVQEKKQAMDLANINAKILLEDNNKKLVTLSAENSKILADAKGYEIGATLKPLISVDPKILQVLALKGLDSGQLIAQAFRDLSENAEKIGQLNVSPDLLKTLLDSNNK